jgi:Na+/H+ antiporter NhaC
MTEQPATPTPHRRIARQMKWSVAAVFTTVLMIAVVEIGYLGSNEDSWGRPLGWSLALRVVAVPALRLLWLSVRLREPGGLWGLGMIIAVFILLFAGSFIAPFVLTLVAEEFANSTA